LRLAGSIYDRDVNRPASSDDSLDRDGDHRTLPTATQPPTLDVDGAGVEDIAIVPWPSLLRRRIAGRVGIDSRWAQLTVVLAGLFTVSCTITLLVVSLKDIAEEFGTTEATMSWAITGPMLAFGVVGPAYGKAGDLWGHKRVFVGGLLGAGLFALLTVFSWSALSMITFRTLSATAGAATGPSTMAYINRLFAPEDRVKPLSYWSFVNAGAPVIGVVAGAVLVDAIGWRIIFAVQAPMCLVGALVAIWLLPDTERMRGVRFDLAGSATLGLTAATLLAGISQGSHWGWNSSATIGCFLASAVGVRLFISVERRAVEPLFPLSWLRTRNVALPILSLTLSNFAYMGGFLFAPRLLENVMGLSTTEIGNLVIARPLTFALAAPIAGYVTIRVGERASGVAGSLAVVLSMFLFAQVTAETSIFAVVVALALSGVGVGVSLPAMTSLVANAVDDANLGVAGAMQQLSSQMGAVLGSVVMTAVQAARESQGLVASYHSAFNVAMFVAAGAVVTAAFVRPTARRQSTVVTP
jgi:MFS family permease